MIPGTKNPALVLPVPVSVPVGAVIPYVGNISSANPPQEYNLYPETQGWMLCDGTLLSTNQYPELFSALGYLYGGSGSSFQLPDLQGMFLRGVSTKSPAATENRKAATNGTADGVGSKQPFALQTHVHTYTMPNTQQAIIQGDKSPGTAVPSTSPTATGTPEQSVSQSPGNVNVSQYETRPDNIFIYYLIKYTSKLPVPHFHPLNQEIK